MKVNLKLFLFGCAIMSSQTTMAAEPPQGVVFTGGGYAEDFLPNLNCGLLNKDHTLSLNPIDIKNGVAIKSIRTSTQAERQFMIQKRMFECQPLAIHAAEKVILANKASIPSEKYDKAMDILFNPERVFSALFDLPFGIRKYFGKLNQVLVRGDMNSYNPADNSYPWIWPKHSLDAVNNALKTAFGGLETTPTLDADPKVDSEIRNYLKVTGKTIGGRGLSPDDQLVQPVSVFFDSNGPTQEQSDLVTKLGQLRRESNEALLCLVKNGLPLTDACPGKRTLADIKKDQGAARILSSKIGVPLMSPFTTKIHSTVLGNYNELCKSVQRAEIAHRSWIRGVRKGTLANGFEMAHEGFETGWMAMFAQSIIMAERAIGHKMQLDDGDAVNQGGMVRACAYALARSDASDPSATADAQAKCGSCFDFTKTYSDGSKAIAVGLDASGNCPLGPIEDNN